MIRTHWSHRLALCVYGAAVALLGGVARADPGAITLRGAERVAYRVGVQHPERFRVQVPRGDVVRLRIRQTVGPVLVHLRTPDGRAHTPRYCQSGVDCVLHVTLVSTAGGTFGVTIGFFVHCCDARQASGTIRVSAPRPATSSDRLRSQAEQRLARAEWAQLQGPSTAWPGALRNYRAAVAMARRSGDVWVLRVALPDEARLDTYELAHYHAALRLARAAARLPYGQDRADQEYTLFALGLVCQYRARYGEAIRAERQALALARALGERQGEDIILGNLAGVYEQIGRTGLALRTARQSLTIAREIGDGKGVDYNFELMAELQRDRGNFNRAFADFQRALHSVRRYPYPDSEARDWIGLGELYVTLGEPAEARSALHRAKQIATAAHDDTALFRVLMDSAVVKRHSGELRAALAQDQRGIARAVRAGLPRQHAALLLELGRDEAALGQPKRAQAAFREAAQLARHIGQLDSEATAWLALGDEATRLGNTVHARADYLRALALARQLYSPLTAARAQGSLARLDWRQGRLAPAEHRIEQAVALIGTVRKTVTTERLRTEYFASEHGYYDLGVRILMALRRDHPGQGFGRAALRMVERARARSLLDALHGAGRVDAALLGAGLVRRIRHTTAQLDVAYADWRDLLQEPQASAARFAEVRRQIRKLRRVSATLETLARARSGRYAALADVHPEGLRQLQRQVLAAHAAVLEYWIGAQRGYAWLIRRHTITTLPLVGQHRLEPEVQALRAALTARSRTVGGETLQQRVTRIAAADANVRRLDDELGAQLLPRQAQLRGIETMYVVADGPLFGVPFAALRPPGASGALIESAAVLQEPSASVLGALTREHPPALGGQIDLYADPVYSRRDRRFAAGVHPAARAGTAGRLSWAPEARLAHLQRLPASRTEALAIAHLSAGRAVLHLGFAASVHSVQQTDWRRVAVAHFAVHTLLDAAHPAFSGLVLRLFHRNGSRAQGVLWLREVYALHMPVDLVVLSSCRTLGGRAVPGEGLDGLFRAFLLAGAHAVVGTLWRVQDRASEQFMRHFYVNLLRRRLAPAAALRAAQLAMLHSRRYASPYFWAAFSIDGVGLPLR